MKKLRNLHYQSKEKFGVSFYLKKQKYRCVYKVHLKNNSPDSQIFKMVVPVPPNTTQQTLLSEPQFFDTHQLPFKPALVKDEFFGNAYALFEVRLEPSEEKDFQQNFDIAVSPFLSGKKWAATFDDYRLWSETMANQAKTFLTPNAFIDAERPEIKKLAAQFRRAGQNNVFATVQKINEHVVDFLEYANPIDGLYSSNEALEKRRVDCGGFDAFLVALCLALGVPARVVSGFWAGYNDNGMHAWCEFLLPDGRWIPADPSMEQLVGAGKSKRSGRLGCVGSDRVVFSYGCNIPLLLDGEKVFTDILQHPFLYTHNDFRPHRQTQFLTSKL